MTNLQFIENIRDHVDILRNFSYWYAIMENIFFLN